MNLLLLAALLLTIPSVPSTRPSGRPYLDRVQHLVNDTSRYESFRLHLINPTESPVYIDRVEASCGCVLATLQNAVATREHPGDVYVAITIANVDSLQPTTIDVYTTSTPGKPMRLYITRMSAASR